jgi:DNA polymerase III subunit epsilon
MLFSVVDVETSGFKLSQQKITEIFIIKAQDGIIKSSFYSLVNPEKEIHFYVQKITQLNASKLKNAPVFTDIASDVFEMVSNTVFVAHNVSFDYKIVEKELYHCNIVIDLPKLCTEKLCRKIFPNLEKYNLNFLSQYFGFPQKLMHSAQEDALATFNLLKVLIENDKNKIIEKELKTQKL